MWHTQAVRVTENDKWGIRAHVQYIVIKYWCTSLHRISVSVEQRERERDRVTTIFYLFLCITFFPDLFTSVYKSYSYLIRIKHFFLYSNSNFSKSNCCWFYFIIRLFTILFKKININIRKLFSVQKIEIRLIMKWRLFV